MEDVIGTAQRFSSTYKSLANDVKPGDTLLLNDGLLKLDVDQVIGEEIHCTIIYGGELKSHKGINLCTGSISAPPLTDKDKADLMFGLSEGVDYLLGRSIFTATGSQ